MTPGPLRPESVQHRLVEISRLLDVLEKYRALSGEDLRADLERRLVIERALSQVVDLAVKINTHVAVAAGHPPPQD